MVDAARLFDARSSGTFVTKVMRMLMLSLSICLSTEGALTDQEAGEATRQRAARYMQVVSIDCSPAPYDVYSGSILTNRHSSAESPEPGQNGPQKLNIVLI